jgi:hypothetical protein
MNLVEKLFKMERSVSIPISRSIWKETSKHGMKYSNLDKIQL